MLGVAETAISDLVYASIAIFFLWSFPERLQRSRLLNLLHQLRSTAHVIDMHQLTKDPEQLKPSFVPTAKSTKLGMTRDQVERYLDYCSEMLSLVGKTAALCAEESRDSVILETVSTDREPHRRTVPQDLAEDLEPAARRAREASRP